MIKKKWNGIFDLEVVCPPGYHTPEFHIPSQFFSNKMHILLHSPSFFLLTHLVRCPISKYFIIVEYLDMRSEDCRLTAIDNVLRLRHAKRLPFGKRNNAHEVEKIHKNHPIDPEMVWRFVQEMQSFIDAVWYDPDAALKRGSFV